MNDDSTGILSLRACLARGGSAEVFALSEVRVLKLYRLGIPPVVAEREADYSIRARAAGLPLPIVFGVQILGRSAWRGFRASRRADDSPDDLDQPRAGWCPRVPPGGAQCSGTRALRTRLPVSKGAACDGDRAAPGVDQARSSSGPRALARLPDEEALCHGELHPGNVILAEGGPVIVDWKGASRGSSLSDVARVVLAIKAGEAKDDPVPDATRSECLRLSCAVMQKSGRSRPTT